jgi:hypothetical protein
MTGALPGFCQNSTLHFPRVLWEVGDKFITPYVEPKHINKPLISSDGAISFEFKHFNSKTKLGGVTSSGSRNCYMSDVNDEVETCNDRIFI